MNRNIASLNHRSARSGDPGRPVTIEDTARGDIAACPGEVNTYLDALDDALEATFPASDPPALTSVGARIGKPNRDG